MPSNQSTQRRNRLSGITTLPKPLQSPTVALNSSINSGRKPDQLVVTPSP
jgi:hypothetical protein